MIRALAPATSLSNKLIIFFLVGALGAMLALTLTNLYISSNTMLEQARARIKARAEASVDHIESYLAERMSDARVIASLDITHNVLNDRADAHTRQNTTETYSNMQHAYNYSAISLLDAEGVIFLSTDENLIGQDRHYRPEIHKALQGFPTISDIGSEPQGKGIFFHVTMPVYDSYGTIQGVVDLRNSLEHIDSIVESDSGMSGFGSYSTLLDEYLIRISIPAKRDLLFYPTVALSEETINHLTEIERFGKRTSSLLQQNTPFAETEVQQHADMLRTSKQTALFFPGAMGDTGEQSEAMIQRVAMTNWYYLHRVPESSFYAPVFKQVRYAVLIMAIVVVLSIVTVIWFARRMLNRPLKNLVTVAKAIAAGDLSRRLELHHRQDEIGELASTFNTMADTLQSRIVTEQEAQETAIHLQHAEAEQRRHLEQTVDEYLAFVQNITQGELHQRLSVEQNGALGMLGNGLNAMANNLQTIITQLQQASANITASAADILSATTQQASSATQQSAVITQTSITVEEVKRVAGETAQQAVMLAQDSQSMLHMAQQGSESVEHTMTGMGQIRQRVDSIAQTILTLSEQTQAIGAITQTVSELADQSNMLALNAAIEAARAGEQGKSFAVVAQQVRDLAERSKAATVQVQDILSQIQHATNAAVMVTEEGSKGVEEGLRLSQTSGQVIHRMAKEVEQGVQSNEQIAVSTHEQMSGMEQIMQAMQAIQQASTQSLDSTRQAEQVARDLHDLAQSLQETIAVYHL